MSVVVLLYKWDAGEGYSVTGFHLSGSSTARHTKTLEYKIGLVAHKTLLRRILVKWPRGHDVPQMPKTARERFVVLASPTCFRPWGYQKINFQRIVDTFWPTRTNSRNKFCQKHFYLYFCDAVPVVPLPDLCAGEESGFFLL